MNIIEQYKRGDISLDKARELTKNDLELNQELDKLINTDALSDDELDKIAGGSGISADYANWL
jgi:hypothetical protein